MFFVEPSFEINEKGRVICQHHSNYAYFLKPRETLKEERDLDRRLTCLTCFHYKNNDCFFPKSEIDKIERLRILFNEFPCKLCGNRIDLLLTIIQKLYIKEKYNIEMPLICCSCYANLKKKNFIKSSEWKANRILLLTLLTIPLIIQALLSVVFYVFSGYLFVFIVLNIIFLLINLKKRKKLIDGIKFYKNFFLNDKRSKNN